MKSIFGELEWLDTDEAVQYLQSISSMPMTEKLLLKLCEALDCPVYVDVGGVSGWDESRSKPATAKGAHKVEFSDAFGMDCLPLQLHTTGATRWGEGVTRWKIDLRTQEREFPRIFKPADIASLAANMSRKTGQPTAATEAEIHSEHPSKQWRQEKAVLEALRQLGHDPVDLPPQRKGLRWVKSDAWDALSTRKDLFTINTFRKTWDRLRASGDIA